MSRHGTRTTSLNLRHPFGRKPSNLLDQGFFGHDVLGRYCRARGRLAVCRYTVRRSHGFPSVRQRSRRPPKPVDLVEPSRDLVPTGWHWGATINPLILRSFLAHPNVGSKPDGELSAMTRRESAWTHPKKRSLFGKLMYAVRAMRDHRTGELTHTTASSMSKASERKRRRSWTAAPLLALLAQAGEIAPFLHVFTADGGAAPMATASTVGTDRRTGSRLPSLATLSPKSPSRGSLAPTCEPRATTRGVRLESHSRVSASSQARKI